MADSYAFLGLGAMGYGMASNVRKKIPSTSTLFIFDVYRPASEKFVAEHGELGPIVIAGSVKEATSTAKYVISSLPSTEIVRKVYLDETDGVLAAPADPERLILETSTVSSSTAKDLAGKLADAKAGIYVDTPVSGGGQMARAGLLSFMIGHTAPSESDPISLRLKTALETMGDPKKLFFCGKLGAGLAAKISNNYIACVLPLLVTEAIAVGVKSGIDKKLLQEVIRNSSGQTFIGDIYGKVPEAELTGRGGFPVNIMIKDVSLGVDSAKEFGIEPRLASAALEIWKKGADDPSIFSYDV